MAPTNIEREDRTIGEIGAYRRRDCKTEREREREATSGAREPMLPFADASAMSRRELERR